MHAVAGKDGASVCSIQMKKGMSGRVSRRGFDMDCIVYLVAVRDHHGLAGFDHRQDAIFEDVVPGISGTFRHVAHFPMGVFGFMKQVLGVGKRGDPPAILQLCVPAHVVHMQMRAHDEVDRFWRDAHASHIFEEGSILHMPWHGVRAMLVIADASVNKDGMSSRLDDVAVQAHQQASAFCIDEMWVEPILAFGLEGIRVGIREDKAGIEAGPFGFDTALYCHLAKPQCFHRCCLPLAKLSRPATFKLVPVEDWQ